MLVYAPNYLNETSLPLVSDVFYHGRIVYFLPTGFHPIQTYSISSFPLYCNLNAVALPQIIWEMCNLYFQNTEAAVNCLNILEPLRNEFIIPVATTYDRSSDSIMKSKNLLEENPTLFEIFKTVDIDPRFVSRELLSHIFYEVFMDIGYKGVIEYLQANTRNPEDFIRIVAAAIINRLKIFSSPSLNLLVYEHSWYPLINKYVAITRRSQDTLGRSTDDQRVKHFKYKLFEAIIQPIFGRCDTREKAVLIGDIARKSSEEIAQLKEQCGFIAREVVLSSTDSLNLKQEILSQLIQARIVEPLGELSRKSKRDVMNLLRDFVSDSTVIGGVLAVLQGGGAAVIGVAAAAGALSSGVRYLLSEQSQKKQIPSRLLVEGVQKSGLRYEQVERQLQDISFQGLNILEEWQSHTDAT